LIVSGRTVVRPELLICGVKRFRRVQLTLANTIPEVHV
jgi:hypothetical protein